jgi:hypothetical protein
MSDGSVQGAIYSVVSTPNAHQTANEYVFNTGTVNLAEIAKRVQVVQRTLSITPELARAWHDAFFRGVASAGAQLAQAAKTETARRAFGRTTIALDGTVYRLTLHQGVTRVDWVSLDEEVDDQKPVGISSVAKLMNEIRRHALKHLTP